MDAENISIVEARIYKELYEQYRMVAFSYQNKIRHNVEYHKAGDVDSEKTRTGLLQAIASKEKLDYYGIVEDATQTKIKLLEQMLDVNSMFPKAK